MYKKRDAILPFALPDLDETELALIREVLDSGWITTGPKTSQFETEFAAAVGARHPVAVNSCTAAMHLALEAIGLQKGDLVFTSPYTFAATAEVVRYFDAVPVLVDIEPASLNIDPVKLDETVALLVSGKSRPGPRWVPSGSAAKARMKAVIPVHFGGLPADLDRIGEIALRHGLRVIEDAAHAFPSKINGKMIGGLSDFSCFSFYASKTITTAEGGMICTENGAWAERCRIMALHGISKDAWKRYTSEGSWYYEIVAPGYKYNMTDIAAAMGIAQLRKAGAMHARRIRIAATYNAAFGQRSELQIPADRPACQHSWHLYPLRLNLEELSIDRSRFIGELKERNIAASVHFIPLHIHPYYREAYGFAPEDFPIAFKEYQRVVSLPIYSKMTSQDVQDVIGAVLDIVTAFNRQ